MKHTNKLRSVLGVSVLAGAMAISATAQAEVDKSNLNPWQHCGIGAAIFDSNETAAALSNVIWDSGTTAVTSATISPDTCESEKVQVAQFINDTYDVLAMETAIGEGEHLQTVIGLAGCSAEGQDAAVHALRTKLQSISGREDYSDMAHEEKAYEFYESLTSAPGCSLS
ncbi:hypothetical protein GCM10027040_29870 [Halomonas shantousis]